MPTSGIAIYPKQGCFGYLENGFVLSPRCGEMLNSSKWVRFAKKTRDQRGESRVKWVRFVILYSFIPVFLFLADPAHAKRHGQGAHLFLLAKGEVVSRLWAGFLSRVFPCYTNIRRTGQGEIKKEVRILKSEEMISAKGTKIAK
jgi:hypothetical protein